MRGAPLAVCARRWRSLVRCRPDPNPLRDDGPQLAMSTLGDERTNMVQCHAGFSLIVKQERRSDGIQRGRERDNLALRVNHGNYWHGSQGSRVDGPSAKEQCSPREAVIAVEKFHNIREQLGR